jgi:hypothetical protein
MAQQIIVMPVRRKTVVFLLGQESLNKIPNATCIGLDNGFG